MLFNKGGEGVYSTQTPRRNSFKLEGAIYYTADASLLFLYFEETVAMFLGHLHDLSRPTTQLAHSL
jgi:hypothetical protein